MKVFGLEEIMNSSFFLVALQYDGVACNCDIAVYHSFKELRAYDTFIRSIQGGIYDEVWVYPFAIRDVANKEEAITEYGNILLDAVEAEGTKVLAEEGFKLDLGIFADTKE